MDPYMGKEACWCLALRTVTLCAWTISSGPWYSGGLELSEGPGCSFGCDCFYWPHFAFSSPFFRNQFFLIACGNHDPELKYLVHAMKVGFQTMLPAVIWQLILWLKGCKEGARQKKEPVAPYRLRFLPWAGRRSFGCSCAWYCQALWVVVSLRKMGGGRFVFYRVTARIRHGATTHSVCPGPSRFLCFDVIMCSSPFHSESFLMWVTSSIVPLAKFDAVDSASRPIGSQEARAVTWEIVSESQCSSSPNQTRLSSLEREHWNTQGCACLCQRVTSRCLPVLLL